MGDYASKGLANGVGIPALVLGSLGFLSSGGLGGLEGQVSALAQATNSAIAGINNTLGGITKTIVPKEAICPEYMNRYNSWTAPTTPAA